MDSQTSIISLDRLSRAHVSAEPFPFLVVENLLNRDYANDVLRDFPAIAPRASFPLERLCYGESFRRLVDELESDEFRAVLEEKLSIDLKGRPTLITVRGHTGERDGQIHADTKSKLVTALLYFNPVGEAEGGRLRILKSRDALDDYVTEIAPTFGKCLIFKVTDNCWHGHKPFVGERKAIQLNYVRDEEAQDYYLRCHNFSAKLKKIRGWLGRKKQ